MPDPHYSLRERSHNKSLITKSSELSEWDFLIRILYKDCYWHFNFRILYFIYYSMLGCVWQLVINEHVCMTSCRMENNINIVHMWDEHMQRLPRFSTSNVTQVSCCSLTYVTLRMPLSPRLPATWLHYHQLYEGIAVLGQRTLSESTILLCGSSSAAHHIGTCLRRWDTTSADWLHTNLFTQVKWYQCAIYWPTAECSFEMQTRRISYLPYRCHDIRVRFQMFTVFHSH